MPNRFTAVPDRPVPAATGAVRYIVPIADVFMIAMISRPVSGTLGSTWVTPATLGLAAISGSAAAVIAVVLLLTLRTGGGVLAVIGAVLCALFAVGAASVVAVGLWQRRRKHR